jgi:hypothetical protein
MKINFLTCVLTQQDRSLIYIFRGSERLLIIIGGIVAMILGTILFRWGVTGQTDASVAGPSFNLSVKNAAPGTIFMLFGTAILIAGMISPVKLNVISNDAPSKDQSDPTEDPPSLIWSETEKSSFSQKIIKLRDDIQLINADEAAAENLVAFVEKAKSLAATCEKRKKCTVEYSEFLNNLTQIKNPATLENNKVSEIFTKQKKLAEGLGKKPLNI